jgi:23S rRNA (adenine2503-C2)-methyltransferase
MISGLTDGDKNAHDLISLLRGQNCHINLIPYNENPVMNFKESSMKDINMFKEILEN